MVFHPLKHTSPIKYSLHISINYTLSVVYCKINELMDRWIVGIPILCCINFIFQVRKANIAYNCTVFYAFIHMFNLSIQFLLRSFYQSQTGDGQLEAIRRHICVLSTQLLPVVVPVQLHGCVFYLRLPLHVEFSMKTWGQSKRDTSYSMKMCADSKMSCDFF